jgi:hypothetical protein
MVRTAFLSHARQAAATLAVALCCCGCLRLETTIELHADGSGTVTERLSFSRRLLKMAENAPKERQLRPLLAKEAALERMKRMGKGIRLVQHETRERADGGIESVAVFKIGYLGDLVYVSPFMNAAPQINELKVNLRPRLHYRWKTTTLPSDSKLYVYFSESKPRAPKKPDEKQTPNAGTEKAVKPFTLPPNTPRGLQAFRDLAPVFADMMDGFHLRLTFKSYAPIDGHHWKAPLRNATSHPKTADLINFSSKNLDRHGGRFIDNEEVMLALLRGYHRFWRQDHEHPLYSQFLAANLRHRQNNHALPMLNNTGGASFNIKPSRALFDRLFKGKTFVLDHGSGKKTKIKAEFNEIGWTPKK